MSVLCCPIRHIALRQIFSTQSHERRTRRPIGLTHAREYSPVGTLWKVGLSPSLETEHQPPRRGQRTLARIVRPAEGLAVAHDSRASLTPGINVIGIGRWLAASPPREEHRAFTLPASPFHHLAPSAVLEQTPRVTSPSRASARQRCGECDSRDQQSDEKRCHRLDRAPHLPQRFDNHRAASPELPVSSLSISNTANSPDRRPHT